MFSIISPALIALFVGSALAVVFAIPYVMSQYRSYGRLGFWRMVGNLALLIYVIALFTYTLTPFPESTQVLRCMPAQLNPLQFIADIRHEQVPGGRLLSNPAFMQVALNVLLFMPLGVLLRGLMRRGVIVATVTGFLVSLAIETTQLTGMWGIYSCAYRVFDVDDLIANTAGALLGSLLCIPVFAFVRAPGERVPRALTAGRRLIGMFADVFLVFVLGTVPVVAVRFVVSLQGGDLEAIPSAVNDWLGFGVPFAIQLLVVLGSGSPLGEHVVALRSETGTVPAVIARPVRFLVGIGGYMLLSWLDFPGDGILLFLLLLASFIAAFVGDKRGLAAAAAGMRIVDDVERRGNTLEGVRSQE